MKARTSVFVISAESSGSWLEKLTFTRWLAVSRLTENWLCMALRVAASLGLRTSSPGGSWREETEFLFLQIQVGALSTVDSTVPSNLETSPRFLNSGSWSR